MLLEINMNQVLPKADVLAVSLSVLCILHCLLLPAMVIVMPSIGSLFFVDESFHIWMVIAVIPISSLALYSGWRKHKILKVGITGGIGLMALTSAAFLGHDVLTENWERYLTILGTLIITLAHIWNYLLWKFDSVNDDIDTRTL
jgi:hypothetical protein